MARNWALLSVVSTESTLGDSTGPGPGDSAEPGTGVLGTTCPPPPSEDRADPETTCCTIRTRVCGRENLHWIRTALGGGDDSWLFTSFPRVAPLIDRLADQIRNRERVKEERRH